MKPPVREPEPDCGDPGLSRKRRERGNVRIRNLWRAEHGLPLIASDSAPYVKLPG